MLTKNFTYSDKIFNHKFDNPVPFLHFILYWTQCLRSLANQKHDGFFFTHLILGIEFN